MEKRFIFITGGIIILSLLLSSFASAELTLSKSVINDVVARELSQPAKFSVKIHNTADIDYFEFYTYVDVILSPKGAMKIDQGETKDVELQVYPSTKLREEKKGSYTFVYYTKGQKNTVEDRLIIRIFPLREMLTVSMPNAITLSDSEITLTVANNESITFSDIKVEIDSAFTKTSQSFSLGAYEKKNITLNLDRNKVASVLAGKYPATVSLTVNNEATLKFEKQIEVRENLYISTIEKESGNLFYPVFTVIKKNEGNVVSDVEVVIRKNAFANNFASFSIRPDKTEKRGLVYTYRWAATLKPTESFQVEVRTNYLLPIGVLLAVLVTVVLIRIYLLTDIIVRKKAVRVKAKGGEFAMKVMIFVKARHPVSDITIRERLPHLAELYERFGVAKPDRFDKARGMLEWRIPSMQAGEETIYSYIFYSKVSMIGRFELPRVFVTFKNAKGKAKQLLSNAVYFFEERRV
jgi:hypothetical protein